MALPSLTELPRRFYSLVGLALGEIQSRDLSELRGCPRKGLGTAVTGIFCEQLVQLVKAYGGESIRVLSEYEPYRFGVGDLEVSVYAMRPRSQRMAAAEFLNPSHFRGNGIRRHLRAWIDEANVAANALPGEGGNPLVPFDLRPLAVLALGLDFQERASAPRLELRGAWLGYPRDYDADTKSISGWFSGFASITPEHDLAALLAEEVAVVDELVPSIDRVLPFRPRIVAGDTERGPGEG